MYLMSLPSRKCGLKFVCAFLCQIKIVSLPSRKCGLKFCKPTQVGGTEASHFLRGSVDWNPCSAASAAWQTVTSFAEVWIEMIVKLKYIYIKMSLPSRKCGLKYHTCSHKPDRKRHFLRGSVDWNQYPAALSFIGPCHFLRGSVDWNFDRHTQHFESSVTSFAEVWIEISTCSL